MNGGALAINTRVSTCGADVSATLAVEGQIDAFNSARLQAAIKRQIDRGAGTIIVDLTGVDYIDSSGLGALVANFRDAKERGTRLRVTGANLRTRRVFDVTGLDEMFALRSDPTEPAA
jgi:anti-sigma B factor antagonist